MIKPFNEMVKLDIKDHIEQKPNFVWDKEKNKMVEKGSFDYLNWAKAIILLYENGAEKVNYKPLKNEAGHSLFMNPSLMADGLSGCPEVRVWLQVDDKDGEFNYPIARGASIVKKENMTQLDIHVCQQRALVKGIAVLTGLGLNLWAKEDFKPEEDPEAAAEAEKRETLKKKIDKVKLNSFLQAIEETESDMDVLLKLVGYVGAPQDMTVETWEGAMRKIEAKKEKMAKNKKPEQSKLPL
jgi:hypothetical protein